MFSLQMSPCSGKTKQTPKKGLKKKYLRQNPKSKDRRKTLKTNNRPKCGNNYSMFLNKTNCFTIEQLNIKHIERTTKSP